MSRKHSGGIVAGRFWREKLGLNQAFFDGKRRLGYGAILSHIMTYPVEKQNKRRHAT